MPQHLVWLFGRAGIPVMEANDGNGNDLPGGNANADEGQGGDDNTPDNQPNKNQPGSDGDGEGDGGDDGKPNKSSGLSDEAAKLLRDVMKHKDRAKQAETELTKLREALGDLKPEEVTALVQARKEQERKDLEKRGEYDRILEQVRQEQERERTSLSEQIDALRQQLNERDSKIEEMTIGRSFSESAFIREKSRIPASIARKEFGTHVDLVEGQIVVFDKPRGAAERTPIVDANGNYKSFEEAIAQLYSSHPDSKDLLKVQGKPGSGSSTVDTGKKPEQQKPQATGVNRIAQALSSKNQ